MMLALQNRQVDVVVTHSTIVRFIIQTTARKADLVMTRLGRTIYPGGLCVNPQEADLAKAVSILVANNGQTERSRISTRSMACPPPSSLS